VLTEQIQDMRWRISQHAQRREMLDYAVATSRSAMADLEAELSRQRGLWEESARLQGEAEARARDVKARLEEAERGIRALEAGRGEQSRRATEARVRLAQAEERAASARARATQAESDRAARAAEAERVAERIAEQAERIAAIEATLLRGAAVRAMEHLRKEASERTLADGLSLRHTMRARRQALGEQVQASRATWRQQQEDSSSRALSVQELTLAREGICARLREDYGVELEALHAERVAAGTGFDTPRRRRERRCARGGNR